MPKFFMYLRKSTDEEDKQVLSLAAQEAELKEYAERERLDVVEVFHESQTAKEPGRPIFNKMVERMEKGEANGIVAWHPDRLARNSVDGGKIIYLVDSGRIEMLKFPTFWFEATPQGKFMLNIAFGQSKYFVDNLSENVKRGLREKLRRGEWPGFAPLGYLNARKGEIVVDKDRAKKIKKMFSLYATGNYTMKQLNIWAKENELFSRKNKRLNNAVVCHILSNPFYYGVFTYNGEKYQASYEPIITKALFDKCKAIRENRNRPKYKTLKPFPYRGLFKCGECGCSITAEKQKGRNYYRCTKKKGPCTQPYLREDRLEKQLREIIMSCAINDKAINFLLKKMKEEAGNVKNQKSAQQIKLKNEIGALENKLDLLLDAKLEGSVDKQEYAAKKEKIINEKIVLEEKLSTISKKGASWLEPAEKFIYSLKTARKTALSGNFLDIKKFLEKLGSNRIICGRKAEAIFEKPFILLDFLPSEARGARAKFLNDLIWLRG